MAEPTPFLPPFFSPPEISSFWWTSIAITPYGIQKVLLTPVGREYSIGLSPLTSSPSMTLTHPPSFAPLLTSPLLPLLLPFLAFRRCFRTWVLTTYQFFLSVPLPPVFLPNERPPSFNFPYEIKLQSFITSVSGSESLTSFTNRTFHLSGPPGFRMVFDAAERNERFGRIQYQSRSRGKRKTSVAF